MIGNSRQRRKTATREQDSDLGVWIGGSALAGAAVAAIAAFALWQNIGIRAGTADPKGAMAPRLASASAPDAVSVAAATPSGTTVLHEAEASSRNLPYAIELGAALSFSALSARYAAIATHNAELGLEALEPRARLHDTVDGLEARLVVGPFASRAEAERTCANIALPANVQCRATRFDGAPISRE